MKRGAKRQVVVCPICFAIKVSLGDVYFRCCGELHKIKENLASLDRLREHVAQDRNLEIVI